MNIDGCIRAMAQSLATVAAAVADTLVPRICPVCGEVLARERIMKEVWDTDDLLESRTIDMHVRTLRQKLGAAGDTIRTVRKVGYKLSMEGSDD